MQIDVQRQENKPADGLRGKTSRKSPGTDLLGLKAEEEACLLDTVAAIQLPD